MNKIEMLYRKLLRKHGQQGWWPIAGKYHPGDFSFPKTERHRFEICVGAILTQNTSWKNAQKAIEALRENNMLSPRKISCSNVNLLASLVRPSGYYNQKARKLKFFADFYLSMAGKTPNREQLLGIWGVGPETADSILLYAYRMPNFVVDNYTRKLLTEMNLMQKEATYDQIQKLFHESLAMDHELFNEFHALIVEQGKYGTARNINRRHKQ